MARETYSIVLNNYRKEINRLMAELNTLEAERSRCRSCREWDNFTKCIEASLEAMQEAARRLGDNAKWHLEQGA